MRELASVRHAGVRVNAYFQMPNNKLMPPSWNQQAAVAGGRWRTISAATDCEAHALAQLVAGSRYHRGRRSVPVFDLIQSRGALAGRPQSVRQVHRLDVGLSGIDALGDASDAELAAR